MDQLKSGKILLSDGAMGTELQKRGLKQGQCAEALNVEKPEIVISIYRDYYQAGSDIVETNSFGGNRARLAHFGLQEKAYQLNRKAAELARSVCPPGKFVAGSMGPTGEMLEPYGTLSFQQVEDYFREQAEALAEGGAHVLFIETMSAANEMEAAISGARKATDLPISATFTFDLSENGVHTSWGVTPAEAVHLLENAGADIIGANCGNGIDVILRVIEEMRPLTQRPLLAQPNAGLPEIKGNLIIYNETPQAISNKLKTLIDLGVNILGGCCGTGPEHIQMMRQLIDRPHDAS